MSHIEPEVLLLITFLSNSLQVSANKQATYVRCSNLCVVIFFLFPALILITVLPRSYGMFLNKILTLKGYSLIQMS